MPTLLSTLAPLFRDLYHQLHPVPHQRIHHHIEYGGGERISLRHSTSSLKRHPVIANHPCHHRQPPPIRLGDTTGSGSNAVTFQDLNAHGPVQGAKLYYTFHVLNMKIMLNMNLTNMYTLFL